MGKGVASTAGEGVASTAGKGVASTAGEGVAATVGVGRWPPPSWVGGSLAGSATVQWPTLHTKVVSRCS